MDDEKKTEEASARVEKDYCIRIKGEGYLYQIDRGRLYETNAIDSAWHTTNLDEIKAILLITKLHTDNQIEIVLRTTRTESVKEL